MEFPCRGARETRGFQKKKKRERKEKEEKSPMRKAAIGNTNIVKNLYGIGRLPLVLDARQTVEARE